ncbi:MAG: acyl carrier protein [Flavobacterium sp. JAD_PAG50586_2]|jgi:acyl carrier protein|nr:MAG: acyl carrier protein [Flavobacterium sp. JAD_PAG50586_2]
MTRTEILGKMHAIFLDELDLEELTLTEETTALDIDEWDSLSHIQLSVAFEKAFQIRFTAAEMQSWKNVGEIVDCIASKI